MPDLIPVLIGIAFVFVSIRVLHTLILEVVWFGAILGFIELYHYQGVVFLGWPDLPSWLLIAGASAMITWIVLRVIYVFSLLPVPFLQPIFMTVSGWVNGR
jgi:hypothetical protein